MREARRVAGLPVCAFCGAVLQDGHWIAENATQWHVRLTSRSSL